MVDFANKKQHYLNEIQKIAKESFNEEQKKLACDILNTATESNIDSIYTFITQRVKTGFVFDAAPEVAHNCISLCERDDKMSFGSPMGVHHKLIIGENYDALKNLVATYTRNGRGLIDVIYIDPPYNTEQTREDSNDYKTDVDSKKFIYRDKFSRTGWLNMMNERLKLAKKLLSDTGVIFISVDDAEQAYLKVLCDEIFGENNFAGALPRITKKGGKSSNNIQDNHDYILVYFKTQNAHLEHLEHTDSGFKYTDKYESERGKYKLNQTLDYDTLGYVNSLDYPIKIGEDIFYPGNVSKEEYLERKRENPKDGYRWRWSEELYKFGMENDFICVNDKTHRIYTKTYQNATIEEDEDGKYFVDITPRKKALSSIDFVNNEYSNDNAKKELRKILGKFKFNYPKPTALLRDLLRRIGNKNAIILDFFAGSGTTGQAVMELNAEDDGQRQFILINNNENNIAINSTYERLYRVINGKGTKGESFEWQYTKEQPYLTENYVDVFNVKSYELKIDDYEKSQKLLDKAKLEFKKLNPDYEAREFDIYNKLASLKPYKPDEVK